jgi:mannose-6-phosphate isomerase
MTRNRVERFYTGGKLLDEWQGIFPARDSRQSEEFLVSTIEYAGTGTPPENGISRAELADGGLANLRGIIASDPEAFLGKRYAEPCRGHSGVQARAGDSTSRLIIQCHPDDARAQKWYNAPFGKTEAWYIAGAREVAGCQAHVYCGFKKGITREKWEALFEKQDVEGMLNLLHRFDVEKGCCALVKAGTPHAIGKGCLFVELHEPCDITLRMERDFNGARLSDEHIHFGAGFDAMFGCYDYTGYEREEVLETMFKNPRPEYAAGNSGGTVYSLIDYEDTRCFQMKKIEVNGRFTLPDFDGHFVLVTLEGAFVFMSGSDGRLEVPQGRGVFVPASCKNLCAEGKGALLAGYPFKT